MSRGIYYIRILDLVSRVSSFVFGSLFDDVSNQIYIRLLFVLTTIHNLKYRSIDFVLVFLQVDLLVDVCIELPFGFDQERHKGYVMKLNKSICDLQQANSNWFEYLSTCLKSCDFFPSQSVLCALYKDNCIVLAYVDDYIIISKDKSETDKLIYSLANRLENYELTNDGEIDKYLDIDIDKRNEYEVELR